MKKKAFLTLVFLLLSFAMIIPLSFSVMAENEQNSNINEKVENLEFTRGFSTYLKVDNVVDLASSFGIDFLVDSTSSGIKLMFNYMDSVDESNPAFTLELMAINSDSSIKTIENTINIQIQSNAVEHLKVDFYKNADNFILDVNGDMVTLLGEEFNFYDSVVSNATLIVKSENCDVFTHTIGEYSTNKIISQSSLHSNIEEDNTFYLEETGSSGIDAYVSAPFNIESKEEITFRLSFKGDVDYAGDWLAIILNNKRGFVQPINANTLYSRLITIKGKPNESITPLGGNNFIKGTAKGLKDNNFLLTTKEITVGVVINNEGFSMYFDDSLQFTTTEIKKSDFPDGVFMAVKSSSTAEMFAKTPLNMKIDFNRQIKVLNSDYEIDSGLNAKVNLVCDNTQNLVLYKKVNNDYIQIEESKYSGDNKTLIIDKSVLNSLVVDDVTDFVITQNGVSEKFTITNCEYVPQVEEFFALSDIDLVDYLDGFTSSFKVNNKEFDKIFIDEIEVNDSYYIIESDKILFRKDFFNLMKVGENNISFIYKNQAQEEIKIIHKLNVSDTRLPELVKKINYDISQFADAMYEFDYFTGNILSLNYNSQEFDNEYYVISEKTITIKKEWFADKTVGQEFIFTLVTEKGNIDFVVNMIDSTLSDKDFDKISSDDFKISFDSNSYKILSVMIDSNSVEFVYKNGVLSIPNSTIRLESVGQKVVNIILESYTVDFNLTITDTREIEIVVKKQEFNLSEKNEVQVKINLFENSVDNVLFEDNTEVDFVVRDNVLYLKSDSFKTFKSGLYAVKVISGNNIIEIEVSVYNYSDIVIGASNVTYDKKNANDVEIDIVLNSTEFKYIKINDIAVSGSYYSFLQDVLTINNGYLFSQNLGSYTVTIVTSFTTESFTLVIVDTRLPVFDKTILILDKALNGDSNIVLALDIFSGTAKVYLNNQELDSSKYTITENRLILDKEIYNSLNVGENSLTVKTQYGESSITLEILDENTSKISNNNTKMLAIGLSVGGAILIAGVVIAIILYRKKIR